MSARAATSAASSRSLLARRSHAPIAGRWLRPVILNRRSSIEAITTEHIVERARGGETLAVQVLADAGEALGTAVATLAMILDVELYVIGSSVAKAGDLLLEPARQAVAHHAHRSVAARVRIVRSELEDDGPILGCGWLARQRP